MTATVIATAVAAAAVASSLPSPRRLPHARRLASRRRVVVVVVVVGRGRGAASGVDTVRGETLRRPRLARDRRRRAYCSPDFRQKSVRAALHCFDFASHCVVYYNVYVCLK
jgi:hypothetical protein